MYAQQFLAPGALLENRYRIVGVLGQGGMSRVYLAEDLRLGVRVAVKENLQTAPEAHAQFEREARILAALSHPNLPRVIDHFTQADTGRQYLVMDYIEGQDLNHLIERNGPLPEATALAWIRQVMYALEYLHTRVPPVIHRDIKPANIKITPQGKAYLVDLGIAKIYDPKLGTLTGARAVTAGYAPPEQYGMRTTERSDIYALGATLYTMLTGLVPPEAPLRMATEEALIPMYQRLQGKASPNTKRAITRAMALETSKRWQSVGQLRAALDGKNGAPPAKPNTRAGELRDSKILIAGLVILGAVVLTILTALAFSSDGANTNQAGAPNTASATMTRTLTQTVPATKLVSTPRATQFGTATNVPSTQNAPLLISTAFATATGTATATLTLTFTRTRAPTMLPTATSTSTEVPTVVTDTPPPTEKEKPDKPTKEPPAEPPQPTDKPPTDVPEPTSTPCKAPPCA